VGFDLVGYDLGRFLFVRLSMLDFPTFLFGRSTFRGAALKRPLTLFELFDMVRYMAVIHPRPGVVGLHIHGRHAARQQLDRICTPLLVEDGFTVKMCGMKIDLITHPQQIPANVFTLVHLQSAKVAEYVTVDAVHLPPLLTFRLVENNESGDKLTINIHRAAVWSGSPALSNNDWPEQPEICLLILADVGVVPPDKRTRICRTRAAFFIGIPTVREASSGRDLGSRTRTRQIVGAFIVLVVTKSVRVHPKRPFGRTISEMNKHRVTDFCADNRPQYTEPNRLRFTSGKSSIRILDISNFAPDGLIWRGDWAVMNNVLFSGSEIPGYIFSLNIIMAIRYCHRGRLSQCQPDDNSDDVQ